MTHRCTITMIGLSLLACLGCKEETTQVTQIVGPQDWQPPVLTWLAPPQAELRGTVGLDLAIGDSSRVDSAVLYVDGLRHQVTSESPYRFQVITDSLSDDDHLLEARAWDQYGNMGVSTILRVNVMNGTPEGPRLIWVTDDFERIQDAINAAQDYDTIRVRDGIFYEALNLFGKGIWVESEHGPLTCTISAGGLTNVFFVPPAQIPATIRGFTLAAAFNVIFMDDGAQLDVFNNLFISDSTLDSSYTLLFTGFGGGHIVNNLFSGSTVAVVMASVLGDFENNILQFVSDYALWNRALSGNSVFHGYNLFWQNGQDYDGRFTVGEGEFNADPLMDLVNGYLLPTSPAIDAGDPIILDTNGSRSDIGPFGGPWAYNN